MLAAVVLFLVWSTPVLAAEPSTYGPTFLGLPSRLIVWVVAQMHLMFAAFVLAVPIFAVIAEIIGWRTKDAKYDKLAKEFTHLLSAAFAITAAFGALLAFFLFGLYPNFMQYLMGIFDRTMYLYGLIFFGEIFALYLYYYSWDKLQNRKGLHILIGVLLNLFGTALMFVANMWVTFMMAPRGVDEQGALLSLAEAAMNPLWMPLNIHRFLGNLAFGGFIVGAYAAVKFLGSRSAKERAYYDWMGYTGNFIGLIGFITLPFAGYYLGREIYSVSTVMGNNMMGGAFSWTFILQAVLIGMLFIGANFYLWSGMQRIPGSERYLKYIKYINIILILCFAIWLTPHNLPLSAEEQMIVGGQYHPVLKYLGLMSAKMAAISFIIISTFISFLLYRRVNKGETVSVSTQGRFAQIPLFIMSGVTLLILGWYALTIFRLDPASMDLSPSKAGYFILPAVLLVVQMVMVVVSLMLTLRNRGHIAQRLYLLVTVINSVLILGVYGFVVMTAANPFLRDIAVAQFIIVISCLLMVTAIDIVLYQRARSIGAMRWGHMSARSQYTLVLLCVTIVMVIALMGFVRSGLREDWHVFGIIRDTSPDAFTVTNAYLGRVIAFLVPAFLGLMAFVFWLTGLGGKPEIAEVRSPENIPQSEGITEPEVSVNLPSTLNTERNTTRDEFRNGSKGETGQ